MEPILNVPEIIQKQSQNTQNQNISNGHTTNKNNANNQRGRRRNSKQKKMKKSSNYEEISMMHYLSNLDEGKCAICKESNGAFIECSHPECNTKFHVLCGWFNGQYMTMNVSESGDGSLCSKAYCIQHTPMAVGGMDRNFDKFKLLRSQGLTRNIRTAKIHRSERLLNSMIDDDAYKHLNALRDTYIPERCAVCFEHTSMEKYNEHIVTCSNCGISVHRSCYLIDEQRSKNESKWYCEPCISSPAYAKSVKLPIKKRKNESGATTECNSSSSTNDISLFGTNYNSQRNSVDLSVDSPIMSKKKANIDAVQCVLCPRKGGALKMADNKYWVHLVCISNLEQIRIENKKIFGVKKLVKQMQKKPNEHLCYLCQHGTGYLIKCGDKECNLWFHSICGVFAGCKVGKVMHCRKHSQILSVRSVHCTYENMKLLKLRKLCDELQAVMLTLHHRQSRNKEIMDEFITNIKKKMPISSQKMIECTPPSQLIVTSDDNESIQRSEKRKMNKMDVEIEQYKYEQYVDEEHKYEHGMNVINAYRRLIEDDRQQNENKDDDVEMFDDELYVPQINELPNYANAASNAVNEIYKKYKTNHQNQQAKNVKKWINLKQFDDGQSVNTLVSFAKYLNDASSKMHVDNDNDNDQMIHIGLDKDIKCDRLRRGLHKIDEKYLDETLKKVLDIESEDIKLKHLKGALGDNNQQQIDSSFYGFNFENFGDEDESEHDSDYVYDSEAANKIKKCRLCGRQRGKWSITVWLKHINNEHSYSCDKCNYKTTKSRYLKEHLLRHKD